MPRRIAWLLALIAAFISATANAQTNDVTVFAAASLKNALDVIARRYQVETSRSAVISYGASSALARQIEQGAPADIFISGDLDWMDYLQARNLIRPETRRNLLGNRIVLVAPIAQAHDIRLEPGAFAAAFGRGRLSLANVAAVPAGKYAKAALEHLGIWSEVAGRLAEAENVRAALTFVARGETPLGVVYETDAKAEPKVRIVARFPPDSHPPIIYPAALTTSSRTENAAGFLDALRAPASAAAFAVEGFTIIE